MSVLNQFTIFNKGGAVLWSKDSDHSVTEAPINTLVQDYILGEKISESRMDFENTFRLEWVLAGEFNLVFVAVYYYQIMSSFPIKKVLNDTKNKFIKMFRDTLNKGVVQLTPYPFGGFDKQFDKIIKHYMEEMFSQKRKKESRMNKQPRHFSQTQKGRDHNKFTKGDINKKESKSDSGTKDGDADVSGVAGSSKSSKEAKLKKLHAMGVGRARGRRKPRSFVKKKKASAPEPQKSLKKAREWNIPKDKVSKKDMEGLNYGPDSTNENESSEAFEEQLLEGEVRDWSEDEDESYIPPNDEEGNDSEAQTGLWGMFNRITTNRPLTAGDLVGPMTELQNKLIGKNVANNIAEALCQSVTKNLIGSRIGSFTTVKSSVYRATHAALKRILTPKYPVNVRAGIERARSQRRPYSIVLVGVNGVGKSTSLAKLTSYLKSHGLKVSIAACDTFRSGAVEQLKTHARALGVRLFEKGYSRDAAQVAYEAIEQARTEKDDVIMVDTAGRMQANKAHMRALSNLIQRNNPDLVLFVGEAIVGNDGVDQLMKFNEALTTFSTHRRPRSLDGIILTKFDTVDDKVGASISMTYECGKPIVFIGVGQKYEDLKRMDVNTMVKMLLR